MTTILATFCIALFLSLVLTPLARMLGLRFGAVDIPDHRKMHIEAMPRTGGLAIFIVFILTLIFCHLLSTKVSNQLVMDRKTAFFLIGAMIVFGIGLVDDFHRLNPKVKFLFQIIAAVVALQGGLHIKDIVIFDTTIRFGPFSYGVTVLWFILFINAINLADGLDGLAGGVVFFVALVMVILSILSGSFVVALLFAALGGAVLGFLRYNFNPASVFMGDGGSYFLGYAVAGLSIMGAVKSQVGAATLIPLLALGLPLFDTILAPVRRFVRGRKMFDPDKGHIHHRLVERGISAKKVVWLIYLITFALCICAILLVNLRNEQAGLFLLVLGAGAIVFVRKLGYFEYLATDKLYGWFRDMTDEAGLGRSRRTFLSQQISIGRSKDLEAFWQRLVSACELLKLDYLELTLGNKGPGDTSSSDYCWHSGEGKLDLASLDPLKTLYLSLPLEDGNSPLGTLVVVKNIADSSPLPPEFLRRIEHLRRTVTGTLRKLKD
jgi:UDP-GlcNAc:undecaprenyl-phosphate GlcNAc-1-phosphate transferase